MSINKIPTQRMNENGLHQKYHISKIVKADPNFFSNDNYQLEPVNPKNEYFVLRLDNGCKDKNHLKACRIAINAYADAIKPFIPELSDDLKERYPLI